MNSFKGALFLNGSGKSVPVRVSFEFDSIRFTLEDGNFFEANYGMIKVSLGGFENRLVELKAVTPDNNAITCFINREDVEAFFEAALRPGVNLDHANISNLKHIYHTDNTLNFFYNWGLYIFGAVITLALALWYFLPF